MQSDLRNPDPGGRDARRAPAQINRLSVIHNPDAGTGELTSEALRILLEQAGYDVTYSTSDNPHFDEEGELYLIAGGDGTVAKMLRRLPDEGPPVAMLPLGSANNIATALGHRGTAAEVIEALAGCVILPFPVLQIESATFARPCFEAVGLGALSQAMSQSSDSPAGEDKLAAGRAVLRQVLEDAGPLPVDLVLDGTPRPGEWLVVEALNVSHTGPGLRLVQDTAAHRGFIDFFLLPVAERAAMIAWLDGPREALPPGLHLRARRAELRWRGDCLLRIDDQVPRLQPDRLILTRPPATRRVLCPPDAPGAHSTEEA